MRWIASLALFLALMGVARAAGPDDLYLTVYNEVIDADALQQNGQPRAAIAKYLEAETRLQRFKDEFPGWNTDVVTFRLQYLTDRLQALNKALAAATASAPSPATPGSSPGTAIEQQIASLQEQVHALTAENGELQSKLKEALSVQPAAVSPVELAKREEEIVALKKERDLLTVDLSQTKGSPASGTAPDASGSKLKTELAAAHLAACEANKKLETVNLELVALKATATNQTASADLAQIVRERDKLKEELTTRTKDLADAEAHGDRDLIASHAQLKEAQAQRDELEKKLKAASGATTAADSAELEQLRARLAVLEAKAVPYTREELAMLDEAQTQAPTPSPSTPTPAPAPAPPAAPPAPAATPTATPKPAAAAKRAHITHSAMELPPGVGGIWTDAMRASLERNYAQAEEKIKEVLRQDETNVYVLAHLADVQFAQGHLEDCGNTVDKALALDPDDPASLYLLGILRYRQEKLDEALNALSRSAQLNSTNPGTQNYLGCVLADKGMRPAAETAFRKALQLEPDYPDAHYNLALIYANATPPSPELARWHYKRALALGHPKSPKLEALLPADK